MMPPDLIVAGNVNTSSSSVQSADLVTRNASKHRDCCPNAWHSWNKHCLQWHGRSHACGGEAASADINVDSTATVFMVPRAVAVGTHHVKNGTNVDEVLTTSRLNQSTTPSSPLSRATASASQG
jgi:hypothetical protein